MQRRMVLRQRKVRQRFSRRGGEGRALVAAAVGHRAVLPVGRARPAADWPGTDAAHLLPCGSGTTPKDHCRGNQSYCTREGTQISAYSKALVINPHFAFVDFEENTAIGS
jgi:hypothetical protein